MMVCGYDSSSMRIFPLVRWFVGAGGPQESALQEAKLSLSYMVWKL
jgi:uncharacterized protein YodC (DUF2158 family)